MFCNAAYHQWSKRVQIKRFHHIFSQNKINHRDAHLYRINSHTIKSILVIDLILFSGVELEYLSFWHYIWAQGKVTHHTSIPSSFIHLTLLILVYACYCLSTFYLHSPLTISVLNHINVPLADLPISILQMLGSFKALLPIF